tara:strand:- start:16740 stop:17255 length:516 start_codon:yes stop_codon:yes gene_type:complete
MEVRVPQERISQALQTESVSIVLPGLPESKIAGKIEALGPVVDPGTRTFLVRVAIQDPPSILRPGMSAVAIFHPKPDDTELLIPRDAIIRTDEGNVRVWVIEGNGEAMIATSKAVELGDRHGNQMTVLSGLSKGDRVVVRGNESLREGQSVRIVSGDEAVSNTPKQDASDV